MLPNCGSSRINRATSAHFISSSHCVSKALICLRTPAAWLISANSNCCTDSRLTDRRYSLRDSGIGIPLGRANFIAARLDEKGGFALLQTFALTTTKLPTLTITHKGQAVGIERKPFTVKLDADNCDWIEALLQACLPIEVKRSSLVNSILTIARTQIQVTPASVQQTPRNLGISDLSADSGSGLPARSEVLPMAGPTKADRTSISKAEKSA